MELFQVVESGEGIERAIRQGLARRGGVTGRCVTGGHPALLVVSPKAARQECSLPLACRTALLPGERTVPEGLRAAATVCYGISPRDSLTISRREKDVLWAVLQRELVTVDGQVVRRQEFPVSIGCGRRELSTLAAVGGLLLLGVPPEELSRISKNEKIIVDNRNKRCYNLHC